MGSSFSSTAEHEADKSFGLPALIAGLISLLSKRRLRARCSRPCRSGRRRRCKVRRRWRRVLLSLNEVIETYADHPRDDLEKAKLAAIS